MLQVCKYIPSIWNRPCLGVIIGDLSFLFSTSEMKPCKFEKSLGFSSRISKTLAAFFWPLFWKILIAALMMASPSLLSTRSEMRRFFVETWLSTKGTDPGPERTRFLEFEGPGTGPERLLFLEFDGAQPLLLKKKNKSEGNNMFKGNQIKFHSLLRKVPLHFKHGEKPSKEECWGYCVDI